MKNKMRHFLEGFTIFHLVGIFLMVAGGFIGSAPEMLTDKTAKLLTETRLLEKTCTARPYQKGHTVRDFCTVSTDDLKAVRGIASSAHETASRIVGTRATFDGAGLKLAFQITFTQIVGGLVFSSSF